MRQIGRLTGREFPALAMKLANLLAVETEGREGLANASAMDRAVVTRYARSRDLLEHKVVHLLTFGHPATERSAEIQASAVDILRTNGIPLNAEIISTLLAARNPLLIASVRVVREALRSTHQVREVADGVFAYGGPESPSAPT